MLASKLLLEVCLSPLGLFAYREPGLGWTVTYIVERRGGGPSAGAVRQGFPGHGAGLLLPEDLRRGQDRFA